MPALSAVDIAVWDLRARRARLPLYRLLGAYRDQVPAYRSLDRMAAMTLQELVEAATADLTAVWRQHPRPGHRPPLSQP